MWMNLEMVMLSERNQIQKTTYCIIQLCKMFKAGKSIETGRRLGVVRGWRRVEWGLTANEHRVSSGVMKLMSRYSGDGCTALSTCYCKTTDLYSWEGWNYGVFIMLNKVTKNDCCQRAYIYVGRKENIQNKSLNYTACKTVIRALEKVTQSGSGDMEWQPGGK